MTPQNVAPAVVVEVVADVAGRDGNAEDDIGLSGLGATGIVQGGTDHNIGRAVAIDVTQARYARACLIPGSISLDHEAVGIAKVREIDRCEAAGVTEDHIGFTRIRATIVAMRRAYDEVIKAVVVHISRGGHAVARIVPCIRTADDEALGRRKIGEVDGAHLAWLAEDHICFARIRASIVAMGRAYDQVIEAVAVDVPRRGDAETGPITRAVTLDDETLRSREAW